MVKPTIRGAFLTVVFGVPAFFLLPALWPASVDMTPFTGMQGLLRTAVSLAEALAFGAGVAMIAGVFKEEKGKRLLRIASGWLLLTVWPLDLLGAHEAAASVEPVLLLVLRLSVIAAGGMVCASVARGER